MRAASRVKMQERGLGQASKMGKEILVLWRDSGLGWVHSVKSQRHPRAGTECWGLQDRIQTGIKCKVQL